MEAKVSEIVVGKRTRKGCGYIDSLENSIKEFGVLQPIGITPDKQLIFGGRRLQACKNLGLETIPARVFEVDADNPVDALKMERDENEQRADLTPSEKVDLARRIEESLAGRVGRPKLEEKNKQNFAELNGVQSRDIAAKAVDWNRETYRQAKAVVESGNEETIEQMDSGEKSVSSSYQDIKKPVKTEIKTFKITLYNNPKDDAFLLIDKAGRNYCTKLGMELLKAAGHKVEI